MGGKNLPGGQDGQTESMDGGEALIYRWQEKFFEGGKAALAFEGGSVSREEKVALERQVEELQKLIEEQAVEIRFWLWDSARVRRPFCLLGLKKERRKT